MMTLRLVLNKRISRATLVVLACSVLLTPTYAFSAERDGTVIYFTFEDLKQMFSHSSPPSLRQVFPELLLARSARAARPAEAH